MKKRYLLLLIIIWIANTIHSYYSNVFIQAFVDLFFFVYLTLGTCYQFYKIIRERKSLQRLRLAYLFVFASLFLLLFTRPYSNRMMEKLDWKISKNKRLEVISDIKRGRLNPDSKSVCKLPFNFPIVSTGGNDILISRNNIDSTVTVGFWVYRSMLDVPSRYIIYTNDAKDIKEMEKQIEKNPKHNWKIENGWYRFSGRFTIHFID